MKTLVAGQLLAYDIGNARDGRSKAINLRLLNPERQKKDRHCREQGRD
jgi:hypothetical protein